jgi:hypothetical protein
MFPEHDFDSCRSCPGLISNAQAPLCNRIAVYPNGGTAAFGAELSVAEPLYDPVVTVGSVDTQWQLIFHALIAILPNQHRFRYPLCRRCVRHIVSVPLGNLPTKHECAT